MAQGGSAVRLDRGAFLCRWLGEPVQMVLETTGEALTGRSHFRNGDTGETRPTTLVLEPVR